MSTALDPQARSGRWSTLRHDLPASIVVFLVAIPLSLGIALASDAPITAGLIAAAVGGVVAAATGGSALQVSGPAAGLTVIVAELVHTFGWAATCAITVAAGALQFLFGLLRVGRAALAISPAVVHGMLAGIGITIVLQQVHVVLGGTPAPTARENIGALPSAVAELNVGALALGLLVIGVMAGWPKVAGRLVVVPAPLLAVVLATLAAMATALHIDVPRVDVPEDVLGSLVTPVLPEGGVAAVAFAVLTVALIAGIESLLSAVAVDKMHTGPRADLNRELRGQGLANMASGALGGLPVTGVIVRSSTNVNAGARSKASAMLHGVWVALFTLAAAALLEQIPLAALAALLVVMGLKMVDRGHVRTLKRHRQLTPYLVTAVGVVEFNLMNGVLLGIATAVVLTLYRLTQTTISTDRRGDRWHVKIEGSLMFVSVPKLTRVLASIPQGTAVDVDLRVDFLDHAAFEALHTWRVSHEQRGGVVDIDEVHESWYERSAGGTPPSVKTTVSPWFLPRQRTRDVADREDTVLRGVREYQREAAPRLRSVFETLADGQAPTQLFITCADSRLMPHLITGAGPGELFMERNVGNLVPRYAETAGAGRADAGQLWTGPGDSSTAATIEFATEVLEVGAITVCGHSRCGAMSALTEGRAGVAGTAGHTALDAWLRHGLPSVARARSVERAGCSPAEHLCQVNVVQQLDNLMTYPGVRRRVEAGTLTLTGLYFDIATAQVSVHDAAAGGFVPVADRSGTAGLAG